MHTPYLHVFTGQVQPGAACRTELDAYGHRGAQTVTETETNSVDRKNNETPEHRSHVQNSAEKPVLASPLGKSLSLFFVFLRAGPANLEFLFVERQEPMVMLWSVRCFPRRFDFVSHFGESTVVQRRRDTCTREPRRKTEGGEQSARFGLCALARGGVPPPSEQRAGCAAPDIRKMRALGYVLCASRRPAMCPYQKVYYLKMLFFQVSRPASCPA